MATTWNNRDKMTKVAVFLLSFLLSPSSVIVVSSFTPQHHDASFPRYKHQEIINHQFRSRPRTSTLISLRAVIDPPSRKSAGDHMDDKRKRKKDENNSNNDNSEDGRNKKEDEWTPVNGGFLPKFLQRQRRRKQQQKTITTNIPNRPKHHTIPNVISIDNIIDYKTIVVDNEEESIVVVRFFASWCKSCRASEPLFRNIVARYVGSQQQQQLYNNCVGNGNAHRRPVKFVQVQLTRKTAYLQEGLGVPSVPFVHVYHPEAGLVEERKFSKQHMAEFAKVLDSYVVGSCDLPLNEETEGKVKGELAEGEDDGSIFGVFE